MEQKEILLSLKQQRFTFNNFINLINYLRNMKNVFMAGVFITLLFCGSPSLSWATSSHTVETVQQKQKIAGVVVDQNGEPIIGANILQKGTSNGTITDINGQFILNCPIGTPLTISYIGFLQQTVKATVNMKIVSWTSLFVFLSLSAFSQDKLMNIEINGKSIPVLISDGDTMMIFDLKQVDIKAPHVFANFTDEFQYKKYKRYAIEVFPYAVKAIKVFRAMENDTKSMSKKEKKKYISKLDDELKKEFETPLKNLSKTQGKILVKMIERELDTPMYSLVKGLKGSWSAFYWNTSGYFWGYHLKDGYIIGADPILDMVLTDFDIDYTIRQEEKLGVNNIQK